MRPCASCLRECRPLKSAAAIDAEQHGLAVEHEGAVAVAQRGLRDQREAIAPVVAVAGP